ncbi:MAG: enoyl-CoA hydratase/isomerase family protein [Alphaproteobacteria bacterium]|nr:enoyl-CoA hydratase/isomerase family protein [Alphaproteobacteria bacterium]
MAKRYQTLLVETPEPHLLVVTLNRPEVANAFDTHMMQELLDVWTGLVAAPGDVRCVVLTGAGTRAFCAGADLKERNGMTEEAWFTQHAIIEREQEMLLHVAVPVIAAVNGAAFAGGLELMLACDFVYAAATARFALTEATLGLIPGAGGTQTLPRAAGERRAKEIVLTGRPFSAEEALAWGMVNRLCAPDRLMAETLETARTIIANAPLAVRQAKKSIHGGLQLPLDQAMRFEIACYETLVATADRREGIAAFNEKRKPRFAGR